MEGGAADRLPPSAGDARENTSGPLLFRGAALFTGPALFWSDDPMLHTQNVVELLHWCLQLPGARLGIPAQDLAEIVRSVYAGAHEQPPPEIDRLLSALGGPAEDILKWDSDQTYWRPHLAALLGWLDRAKDAEGGHLWLDPQEADWWLEATARSLADFSAAGMNGLGGTQLVLMLRHRCTVFGQLDGAALWDHFQALVANLSSDGRQYFDEMLSNAGIDRSGLAGLRGIYWSWHLLSFGNADGELIYNPLLSLWNDWPAAYEWAPACPADLPVPPLMSADETAGFLRDVLYQQVERVFTAARDACGLGFAAAEFGGLDNGESLFFFAAPEEAPVRAESYAGELKSALHPLIARCLHSSDSVSDQVAWGVLEGDVVALRREYNDGKVYSARYLLLPVDGRPATVGQIESDVGMIAYRLNYIEFTIVDEASRIFRLMGTLRVRRAMWARTYDGVSDVTAQAMDLLPTLGQATARRVTSRLDRLHDLLSRLQLLVEQGVHDTNRLRSDFGGYVDSTDDYLLRRVTFSPLSLATVASLSHAVRQAYPYVYQRQPLQSLREDMDHVRVGIEHLGVSLTTILDRAVRKATERLTRLGGRIGLLVALAGLLVALSQFVAVAPAVANQTGDVPLGISDAAIRNAGVDTVARLAADGTVAILIVALGYYALLWLIQRRPHGQTPFAISAQRFRSVVEQAASAAQSASKRPASKEGVPAEATLKTWRAVERFDEAATLLLARMWAIYEAARVSFSPADGRPSSRMARKVRGWFRSGEAAQWMKRARLWEYSINLFDLCPERIPLPRTLCVLRLKSQQLRGSSTVAASDFRNSLLDAGFSFEETQALSVWLSNLRMPDIAAMDVASIARALAERGVSADPQRRTPSRWHESLTGPVAMR